MTGPLLNQDQTRRLASHVRLLSDDLHALLLRATAEHPGPEYDGVRVAIDAGFGASSTVHTDKILRLSLDLPIIIEVVETEEAIQKVLPDLDEMIGGGLITLERARVIMYRPGSVRPSQQEMHRIEGLEEET